jgi:hypothetical protein
MTWTLVDDEPNINVRAIINPRTQTQELGNLITALIERLPKEPPDDGRPALVRPGPRNPGPDPQAAEEAKAEAYQKAESTRAGRDPSPVEKEAWEKAFTSWGDFNY